MPSITAVLQSDRMSALYERADIAERPAILYKDDHVTYGELHEAVLLCSVDLKKRGVKTQDCVALWGYSCIEWVICYFAILRIGASPVLLNHGMPLEMIVSDFDLFRPDFVVAGNNSALKSDERALEKLGEQAGLTDRVFTFEEGRFLERLRAGERADAAACPDVSTGESIVLLMTSGSVGVPQMVRMAQKSLMADVRGCVMRAGEYADRTLALGLPLFHSFGMDVFLSAMCYGQPVYLAGNLKPKTLVNLVKDSKAPYFTTVGALLAGMLKCDDFDEAAQYLRFVILGGGLTPVAATRALTAKYPQIVLDNGYGLTESCGAVCLSSPEAPLKKRLYSLGTPLDGTDIRTIRPDGTFCDVGEHGEIVIKGPTVMVGYFNVADEDQPFNGDGWLHTGDLGYVDEEGYVFFAGRLKDIIIRRGENVVPANVEYAIMSLGVAIEAKVVGIPSEETDDRIVAVVTPASKGHVALEDVREALKQHIPNSWLPDHLIYLDAMPRNASGKIDSVVVRRIAQEQLN